MLLLLLLAIKGLWIVRLCVECLSIVPCSIGIGASCNSALSRVITSGSYRLIGTGSAAMERNDRVVVLLLVFVCCQPARKSDRDGYIHAMKLPEPDKHSRNSNDSIKRSQTRINNAFVCLFFPVALRCCSVSAVRVGLCVCVPGGLRKAPVLVIGERRSVSESSGN